MCCVLLGMHFFTYIKRVEKEIMDKKKSEKRVNPSNRPMVHPKKSQDINGTNGNNTVQIKNGDEASATVKNAKHELSPNLTNRKTIHADV